MELNKDNEDLEKRLPPTTLKGSGFTHSLCENQKISAFARFKMRLTRLLQQPSTWRGLLNACGGITGALAMLHALHPIFVLTLPVCMAVAGMIGTFTDDYAETESKLDDILHAAASAVQESANAAPQQHATDDAGAGN